MATAKNMPGDSADLFGDGGTEDGSATNGRLWRTVIIGEQEHRIDLQMIKPYMRVVTHGGEHGEAPAWLPAWLWVPLCHPGGDTKAGWTLFREKSLLVWCLCEAEKHKSAKTIS